MSGAVVQKAAVVSKEEMVGRLARHLEQQPESVRASDRLMKRLEVASLILPLAAVVAAIVVIARQRQPARGRHPGGAVRHPACLSLLPVLRGAAHVLIRAFPPVRVSDGGADQGQGFFTGRGAVGMGVYVMVGALCRRCVLRPWVATPSSTPTSWRSSSRASSSARSARACGARWRRKRMS